MNRNRGSNGEVVGASRGGPTGGRASAEVIYVGRSSFWVDRDIDLFEEMPESPWPALEVASELQRPNEHVEAGLGVVASPQAVVTSGAVIMGINLSGPIILQAADEGSRREDSNGTPLPAGEVAVLTSPVRARAAWPSPLSSLMVVTVVAFSLGLVVSPLGDGTVLRRSGARTTLPMGIGTAVVPKGPAIARPSDNVFRPLVVPSGPSPSSVGRGRGPQVASKSEHVGLKLAIKRHVAKQRSAIVAPSQVTVDVERTAVTDGDQEPSRKSIDKESIDATKASASADSDNGSDKKAAKPWVDPWAD